MNDRIKVIWTTRERDGSCNVCQRRDDMPILLVSLPTIGFRLCRDCAVLELMQKLHAKLDCETHD